MVDDKDRVGAIRDPKQDIDSFMRYRGVWEGSVWRKNKGLSRLALFSNLVAFILALFLLAAEYSIQFPAIVYWIILFLAVAFIFVAAVVDLWILYLIFFSGGEKNLSREEKEEVEEIEEKIEEANQWDIDNF